MFILAPIGAVLGLFALYVATRPGEFRTERSLDINASPATLFALINDFHEWAAWSPWEKMDPTMTKSYEGPSAGKGAVYRWHGNNKVGEGVMTILESNPDSRIDVQLQFIKPFAATNKAIFTLVQAGTSTKVTWAMEGNKNFMMKAFGVFMNMDELVGTDFERGLAAMRDAAVAKG